MNQKPNVQGHGNAMVRFWHCEKCLWQSKTNGLTQGQATQEHDAANIVLRVRCNSIPAQKPNAKLTDAP